MEVFKDDGIYVQEPCIAVTENGQEPAWSIVTDGATEVILTLDELKDAVGYLEWIA